MDLTTFAHAILFICKQHDASVTSWIRSEKHNAAVGGKAHSWHLDGLGADVVPDDPARKPFIILTAARLGLQAIDEGAHVHIEPPGARGPLGP